MDEPRRPRVLVAVQPLVLEGALASILDLVGLDEVVQFETATEPQRAEEFDAAIVSARFPSTVRATVVVTLPDTHVEVEGSGDGHRGRISTGASSQEVTIHDQHDVLDLLDVHVPAAASRRDHLSRTFTTMAS